MPIRNVTQRTRTTVRYKVPSPKNGRVIAGESGLERDLILRLEFAPNVVAFEEQPARFKIPGTPKDFHTTPDIAVTLDSGEIHYVEVKYARTAKKHSEKLNAIRKHLASKDIEYRVMTELNIRRSQAVLDNCLYLTGFKGQSIGRLSELRKLIPEYSTTVQELSRKAGSVFPVMEMIAHQLVFFDFNQPLRVDSRIRPLLKGDYGDFYPHR